MRGANPSAFCKSCGSCDDIIAAFWLRELFHTRICGFNAHRAQNGFRAHDFEAQLRAQPSYRRGGNNAGPRLHRLSAPSHTFRAFTLHFCRCPDTVNFRLKPVIGATYQTLKEKLQGLGKDIQAVDPSDLSYETIKNQLG
jgi:hypothetical protein